MHACVSIPFLFGDKKMAMKTDTNPELLSPIIIDRFDLLVNLTFSIYCPRMEQTSLQKNIDDITHPCFNRGQDKITMLDQRSINKSIKIVKSVRVRAFD